MRTYKSGVAGLFLAGAVAIALMVDLSIQQEASAKTVSTKDSQEKVAFTSVEAAYRQGIGAYRAGRIDIAMPALIHAADNNNMTAMFLLARLHSGHTEGLAKNKRNPLIAFQYYKILAGNLHGSQYRYPHGLARAASDVFLALAEFHRNGLGAARIKPSDEAAVRLYRHAAVNYHHPEAEYLFATAFRNGKGVHKSYRNAARWYYNSAKKNYAPAQAKLGMMYWNGEGLVIDQARALALLKVAVYYSNESDLEWIKASYEKVLSSVSPKIKGKADHLYEIWQKEFGVPQNKPAAQNLLITDNKTSKPKNDSGLASGIAKTEKPKNQDIYLHVEPVYKGNTYIPTNLNGNNKHEGLRNAK